MLEQHYGSGFPGIAPTYSHRERTELKALRIHVGAMPTRLLDVHLPRLPVIPRRTAANHFDACRQDHALRLTIAIEICL